MGRITVKIPPILFCLEMEIFLLILDKFHEYLYEKNSMTELRNIR